MCFVLLGFIWRVIYCLLSRCSFRRVGHDDAVTNACYEAEDPEGLAHEGMPPSLEHVDPSILNVISYVVYKHTCFC